MSVLLTDTDASHIAHTLTQLRHRAGASTLGSVLSLVIICDEAGHYDAARAAMDAAREHPSRLILVIPRGAEEETRADAEIRADESTPGEIILLRLYGELRRHADSLVSPLLLVDTPVVAWWPGNAPEVPAKDPIGALAHRRITDATSSPHPIDQLLRRHRSYVPGDSDLAWTRLTSWRSLLAAAFDQPMADDHVVLGGTVDAPENSPSAPLLAAWLSDRLDVPVTVTGSNGPGISGVRLRVTDGEIAIVRPDGRVATLSRPGQPDRQVALLRRATSDLLAEELRRLDPDEIYGLTLARLAAEAQEAAR